MLGGKRWPLYFYLGNDNLRCGEFMSKKTPQDPTGQARNRRKGTKQLSRRLVAAEREMKALFRSIPRSVRRQTSIQNAEQKTFYDYDYNAQAQADLTSSTEFILNDQLLETQTGIMPFAWYWKKDIELPYRQGTAEEVRDFNQLVAGAVVAGTLVNGIPPQAVPIEQVLISETYRARLGTVQVSSFGDIKALSEKTAAQVMQEINSGIEAKVSPSKIGKRISERFRVSRSDAKRIAETEVNKAYNDAKLDTTKQISAQTGLRAGVVHVSALLPTTRSWHADRHGNAYTVEDQTEWWNTGTNRIYCHCTTKSILIGKSGEVINVELQEEIREEGESFFNRTRTT